MKTLTNVNKRVVASELTIMQQFVLAQCDAEISVPFNERYFYRSIISLSKRGLLIVDKINYGETPIEYWVTLTIEGIRVQKAIGKKFEKEKNDDSLYATPTI